MGKSSWRPALALLAAAAATGSGGRGSALVPFAPNARPALQEVSAEAAPFDVQAVVRRAHFAFRPDGERFTGGHSTYSVEADARRLRVSPVQRRPAPNVGKPLVVETTSIGRGTHRLRTGDASSVDPEGRLVRRGGAVTETIQNRGEGVEVSWTFPDEPQGAGDLVVRVAASGLEYAGSTAGGLHFADRQGGLGLRYGHATWIGGGGERTEVPARWDGREIVIAVPARVVEGSAYPAVLDPVIGPEYGVDSPVTGSAAGDQDETSLAHSGSISLIVWSDRRSAVASQIFGTRVSSGGAIFDPNGIAISAPGQPAGKASVVWDGSNFLVVYQSAGEIYGRRVNLAGGLVDASPFLLSSNSSYKLDPFAYSNGTTTLVAWSDYRNFGTSSLDVFAARVTGATVDPDFAVSTAAGDQSAPRSTFGGGQWFVAWEDRRNLTSKDVYGARVDDGTGALLDATGIPISTLGVDEQLPWPASDGTDFFVAWQDNRSGNPDIWGARVVSATGTVTDAAGIQVCNDGSSQDSPSVAFNGGNYQLVWEDSRGNGLWGNRVSPAGALQDGAAGAAITGPASIDTTVYGPRVSAVGADFYVGWSQSIQYDSSNFNVFGSRLTAAQSLEDAPGVSLTGSGNHQGKVAVAADGTNYFVVWLDERGGTQAVYGARVSGATGQSLDPAGILLSGGGVLEAEPGVAFNGTHYLVVWQDQRVMGSIGIFGTRVAADGTVVDPSGLNLFSYPPHNPYEPKVASDGDGWFVVWKDYRNAATGADIYGGRVSAAGTVVDPAAIPLSNAPQIQAFPRVGFGGGYYLVAWQDYQNPSTDIYAARVHAATGGVASSGIPIAVGPQGVGTGGEYGVAYASPNFMLVYAEEGVVRRSRIAAATGAIVDDAALTTGFGASGPAIAYDQDTFVVVYGQQASFGNDLKGTRVSAAGADLDAVDWDVTTGGGVLWGSPGIAALGPVGKSLAAYSRYDSTPGVTSQRARARLVTRDPVADLVVTKTDGVTSVVPGTGLTYTVTVSNAGPDDVPGATVTDTFPSSLACSTTCVGSGLATCAAGPFAGNIDDTVGLPVGESVTYTSVCTVSAAAAGEVVNTATAGLPSGGSDPTPGNDSATDTDAVTPDVELSVTKTDGQTTVVPGQILTYTIGVANAGPHTVLGATVTDTLSSLLQGAAWTCSASAGSSCPASGSGSLNHAVDLLSGGTLTYTLTATVDPNALAGPLVNTAGVAVPAGANDPNPTNDSASDIDTVVIPQLTIGDVAVGEGHSGNTPSSFTVTLSPAAAVTVTVSYATQDGTALFGNDYAQASGMLTFLAGETTKPVPVSVLGDTLNERPETFTVTLSGASGAAIGDDTGTGAIRDDEDEIVQFDADTQSDLTVFHPSSGLWFMRNSTDGVVGAVGYGGPGYTPVAADYDGDGITDVAVYHAATGLWFIRESTTLTTTATGFGGPDYAPVRGDFDGDGKTDLGVFHDATGLWFIRRSSTGAVDAIGLGASGYLPVPGDYDGDGTTDLAVYHPPSGLWFTRASSTLTTTTTGFGGAGFAPVRGDFDGDGQTDLAVFHAASGGWYIRNSSTSTVDTVGYGAGGGYTPVPGKHDADGKTDLAVYHAASGHWFLRSSLAGGTTTTIGFGGAGYTPVH